jgi:hypothetical protein
LRVQYRLTPWWAKVVVIFVASRIITTVLLMIFAAYQGQNPWTAADPNYFDYASIWDGRWYNLVELGGYPSQLPHDAQGHVGQNAWAFLPAYPYLVGAIMYVTQLSWPVAGVLVSVGFGLGSALLLYKLLLKRIGQSATLFAVVLFCVAPLSPMFQVAYAESMYLFFLVLALYLLEERRYWLMLPAIAVMAFTRPSGLAFALFMGFHVIWRWRDRRRRAFPLRQQGAAIAVTIFSGIAGLAWPAIAALATGSLGAYTDTELAWRADYIGYGQLVPFSAWFEGAQWWFTTWLGLPIWLAYTTVVLIIALFVTILMLPATRKLGNDLRLWLAAYAIYLLAVFFPQSSTFRLLMPMFPLLGAVAQPKSRAYRIGLVVVCVAGQAGWIAICWAINGADWSPP